MSDPDADSDADGISMDDRDGSGSDPDASSDHGSHSSGDSAPPSDGFAGPSDSASSTDRAGSADADAPRRVDGGERTESGTGGRDRVTIEDDGVVRWFLKTNDGTIVLLRDVLSSVAIVAVIGLLLFAVSGVWPPLVAVESGSMEPNMERGDLIFVVDEDRYAGDGAAAGTGIVTAATGEDSGYEKFGGDGDVIIFQPNGNDRATPVIHRAQYHVEAGDNWVERADSDVVRGASCSDIQTCPAEHDGFVTKGDANDGYDQDFRNQGAGSDVVKDEWVTGKAMFRIPYLGYVRLAFDGMLANAAAPGLWSSLPLGLLGVTSAAVVAGRRPGRP
ncbi:S26 family signal peptidase [Natrialbaceae archaeon GCM10025810]|uniref:S26 family signal peptidase n=1 Tax=Halovalidus salilacus TaxID=3075124 RepID=UPI003611C54A